jgi:hypothetical protein
MRIFRLCAVVMMLALPITGCTAAAIGVGVTIGATVGSMVGTGGTVSVVSGALVGGMIGIDATKPRDEDAGPEVK